MSWRHPPPKNCRNDGESWRVGGLKQILPILSSLIVFCLGRMFTYVSSLRARMFGLHLRLKTNGMLKSRYGIGLV